jgi:hypothetical protein
MRMLWTLLVAGSVACSGGGGTSDAGGDASPVDSAASDGGGNDGAGGDGASDAAPSTACTQTGAALSVGGCQAAAMQNGDVPKGCAPSVDGALHLDEWQDSACFVAGGGDMTVYVKYAGDSFYMATIGNPTCGCTMDFAFDPDGATTLDGDEFVVKVFDDPFGTDGDRSDWAIQGGSYVAKAAPAGIVTACPGNTPTPIGYEWKVPLADLAVQPGASHTFRLALVHAQAKWPSALTLNGSSVPNDPSSWGTLSSNAAWQ